MSMFWNKLFPFEQKEGTSGSLSREVALERELNEASEKINKLKAEKEQLDASVQVRKMLQFIY